MEAKTYINFLISIYKTGALDFVEKFLLKYNLTLDDNVKSLLLTEIENFISGAETGSIAELNSQQDAGSNPASSTIN